VNAFKTTVSEKREKIKWQEEDTDDVGLYLALEMTSLVYSSVSPYQNIKVYKHDYLGTVLILDDVIQTTERDEYIYNEMLCHVVLLGSASPSFAKVREDSEVTVAIIGGGDCGVLREVLKHKWVKKVVMVEIDGEFVAVAKKYLDFKVPFDDPRGQIIIGDGAEWIRNQQKEGIKYDAVIIDSSDPIGPGAALFTNQFYVDIQGCLKPHGVMAQQVGMPFVFPEQIKTVVDHLKTVCSNVQVFHVTIPTYGGGPMGFVVCTRDGAKCEKPVIKFDGRYYNSDVHTAAFALPNDWKVWFTG